MAMSPGRKEGDWTAGTAPIPKSPGAQVVAQADRDEGIVPPIVTKSGQKEMGFITVWQASREILTHCLNVPIFDPLWGFVGPVPTPS
jgi:hypothetical protein